MRARVIGVVVSTLLCSIARGDPAATAHVAQLASRYAEAGGSGAVEVIVTPRADAEPQRAVMQWRVERQREGQAVVALQLGDLRLHAADGRGVAARGGRYFEWRYDEPLTMDTLARVLPEIPVMALAMSLGDDGGGVDWLVLTRRDTGVDHVIGRAGDDLIGVESRGGVIERVVRQRELPEPWTVETVRQGPAAISADPIDTEGSARAGSLPELFAPPVGLVAGAALPELGLMGRDGLAWEPYLACDDGIDWMVVAIVPADDMASATRAGVVLASSDAFCPSLVARFDLADFSKAARRTTLAQWSVVVAGSVPIAWTVSDIAIGDGVLAVISPDGTVAGVRALDAEAPELIEWVRAQIPAGQTPAD